MSLLGNRLNAVTEILKSCENNSLFADIGSDHAFLAAEVVKQGIAKSAIAADINEMPLLKGKENAENSGVKLEFILSDGFDEFDGRDISSAAVCGMGGELIAKIVLRSKAARRALLALQPMSAQEELRKALWDNGFEIRREIFTYEAEKPYTVMEVRYSGKNSCYDYLDIYLGKERKRSPEFSKYCEKILHSAQKRRLGIIARNESTKEIDSLIEFCQTQTMIF